MDEGKPTDIKVSEAIEMAARWEMGQVSAVFLIRIDILKRKLKSVHKNLSRNYRFRLAVLLRKLEVGVGTLWPVAAALVEAPLLWQQL